MGCDCHIDRLLLGLKGTMSEAELHVLQARLRGGILNKVSRGEYRCQLPTGFVYDDSAKVVLDPDAQVREAMTYFFETFARVGSAHQTVKVFRQQGLRFPARLRRQGEAQVVFREPSASAAMRMLRNPRYAGAYTYGRRRYRRTATGKPSVQKRPCSEWLACIQEAQPGYITWEQYQTNQQRLKANGRGYGTARTSPPREGSALLQGRAVCGRCGRQMRVRYAARRGRSDVWYVCDRAREMQAAPNCQSIAGRPIDEAVGALVVQAMTPKAVELALEIRAEVEARQRDVEQLHDQAIARAQIDADLAQRRYLMVDPSNRLVADTLEANWNETLRALAKTQQERERYRVEDQPLAEEVIRDRLRALTTDFQQLWADPATSDRERKQMLAYLIEDVTLIKFQADGFTKLHVRFQGGKTETLTTLNPKASAQLVKTPTEIVALVDQLLDDHIYAEIAELLNEQGHRPGGSARPGCQDARFTATRVAYLVHRYGLRSRYDRLRARGLLTKQELAAYLGVHEHTIVRWAQHDLVTRHAYNGQAYLYEKPGPNLPAKHCSRWDRLAERAAAVKANAADHQGTTQQPKEV